MIKVKFDLLQMYFEDNDITVYAISKVTGISAQALNNFKARSFTGGERVTNRITGLHVQKIAEALAKNPGKVFNDLIYLENEVMLSLEELKENTKNWRMNGDSPEDVTTSIYPIIEEQWENKVIQSFLKAYMKEFIKDEWRL
ncbi:hypothetical protein QNN67_15095 [Listeria monocytogenes]|uniref:hypothetical protein n=1 Tax=Listeria monocytogenes TaxID=1639 RepID=UPI00124AD5E3|nr:hypothetical protein [Listeria monocytogenes]EAG7534331.1 hypothetical protein [Listeria monocytogenes]EAH2694838.1 hypothetical protein [Listeria monocytogenes]EAH2820951.1 hypothetical protein [Listeria monocytogenes]EAH3172019.1 hypothetical protein [Listeria monocytogenes]EGP8880800.1 hypothetical protein [Listeria monocytogenes]